MIPQQTPNSIHTKLQKTQSMQKMVNAKYFTVPVIPNKITIHALQLVVSLLFITKPLLKQKLTLVVFCFML